MTDPDYTPTQRMLLEVLSDGLPHKRDDLRRLIDPDLCERATLRVHISHLRHHLRLDGQNILCVWHKRVWCYQQVKLINPSISKPPLDLETP